MFSNGIVRDERKDSNETKTVDSLGSMSVSTNIRTDEVTIPKTEPTSPSRRNSYESASIFEAMKSPGSFTNSYKVKYPIVTLERCDKIWETLKFIKNIQNENSEERMDDLNENSTSDTDLGKSYIKYQPILGNDNTSLPNFKFSVKSTKKLYHCGTCGKQYSENRALRVHSLRIHGIFIPLKRHRKYISPEWKNHTENSCEKTDVEETKDTKLIKLDRSKSSLNSDLLKMSKDNVAGNINSKEVEDKKYDYNSGNRELVQFSGSRKKVQEVSTHHEKCPLCKRDVRYMAKHLTEYHKIRCPNLVMKEFEQSVPKNVESRVKFTLKDFAQALTKRSSEVRMKYSDRSLSEAPENNPSDRCNNNIQEMDLLKRKQKFKVSYLVPHKRQKLNNGESVGSKSTSRRSRNSTKTYQCDICLGIYASYNGLYKHKRNHRFRGETKENIHTIRCRYLNSPLHKKHNILKTSSNSTAVASSVSYGSANDFSKDALLDTLKDKANKEDCIIYDNNDEANEKYMESDETVCICGRSFRNPHTLFLHKSNCKLSDPRDIDMQEIMSHDIDKDSGVGISITIKKKNDSYEIVGRDSSDENKSKDSGHLKDYDISNSLYLSTYSKNHSVLKVKPLDDDIYIDVEHDSQYNFLNKNDKKMQSKESLGNKSNVKEQNEISETIPTLKQLCTDIISHRKINNVSNFTHMKMKKVYTSRTQAKFAAHSCPCGKSFVSPKNRNIHITRSHPKFLRCGYCEEKFSNINWYNTHRCKISEGKKMDSSLTHMKCPCCTEMLEGRKNFEWHVKSEHFDPTSPFQCYNCKEKFTSSAARHIHFTKEHSRVSCTFCGMNLHISIKNEHEGYHYGFGFPCHICKKSYVNQKSFLQHHKMTHEDTGNKLLTCNICFKKVKAKSFRWHIYGHRNVEACKLCKKVLCDRRSLEYHIMIRHEGRYPWIECYSCAMQFLNKKTLERHLQRDNCFTYKRSTMNNTL